MNILIYLHYFLFCIFGCRHLPKVVIFNNEEWFSACGYENGYWYSGYYKYVDKYVTEELIEVQSKYRHMTYFKVMYELWKMRNKVEFGIDY